MSLQSFFFDNFNFPFHQFNCKCCVGLVEGPSLYVKQVYLQSQTASYKKTPLKMVHDGTLLVTKH